MKNQAISKMKACKIMRKYIIQHLYHVINRNNLKKLKNFIEKSIFLMFF